MDTKQKNNVELLADSCDIAVDIPQGYYLSWFCTTQAEYRITVTLKDEYMTYFSGSKSSIDIEPPLAQGSATLCGKNLRLLLDIPQSMKISIQSNKNILEENGREVLRCYTWFVEDSDDNDFNDMHLCLIGWKNRG